MGRRKSCTSSSGGGAPKQTVKQLNANQEKLSNKYAAYHAHSTACDRRKADGISAITSIINKIKYRMNQIQRPWNQQMNKGSVSSEPPSQLNEGEVVNDDDDNHGAKQPTTTAPKNEPTKKYAWFDVNRCNTDSCHVCLKEALVDLLIESLSSLQKAGSNVEEGGSDNNEGISSSSDDKNNLECYKALNNLARVICPRLDVQTITNYVTKAQLRRFLMIAGLRDLYQPYFCSWSCTRKWQNAYYHLKNLSESSFHSTKDANDEQDGMPSSPHLQSQQQQQQQEQQWPDKSLLSSITPKMVMQMTHMDMDTDADMDCTGDNDDKNNATELQPNTESATATSPSTGSVVRSQIHPDFNEIPGWIHIAHFHTLYRKYTTPDALIQQWMLDLARKGASVNAHKKNIVSLSVRNAMTNNAEDKFCLLSIVYPNTKTNHCYTNNMLCTYCSGPFKWKNEITGKHQYVQPVVCPVEIGQHLIKYDAMFCNWGCAFSWGHSEWERRGLSDNTVSALVSTLKNMASALSGVSVSTTILPQPSPRVMKCYGGVLTREQYLTFWVDVFNYCNDGSHVNAPTVISLSEEVSQDEKIIHEEKQRIQNEVHRLYKRSYDAIMKQLPYYFLYDNFVRCKQKLPAYKSQLRQQTQAQSLNCNIYIPHVYTSRELPPCSQLWSEIAKSPICAKFFSLCLKPVRSNNISNTLATVAAASSNSQSQSQSKSNLTPTPSSQGILDPVGSMVLKSSSSSTITTISPTTAPTQLPLTSPKKNQRAISGNNNNNGSNDLITLTTKKAMAKVSKRQQMSSLKSNLNVNYQIL